jgi:hypothetical protein
VDVRDDATVQGSMHEAACVRRWIATIALFVSMTPGCIEDEVPSETADETGTAQSTSRGATTASEASTGADACDAATVATIFAQTCVKAGCHDANAPAGGLDLSVADLEARLVGVASGTCAGEVLVVAGDPDASFLVEKLSAQPDCGLPMPVGAPLPGEQIECVRDWVSGLESSCETCGGNTCVDAQTDAAHCGACDSACPAGVACVGGECDCSTGTTACEGSCVDTQSNPAHCGGCGAACPGIQVCLAGSCSSDCGVLDECDGACVDLIDDPLHCGSCDNACGSDEACAGGACSCDAAELSYAADIEPLLVDQCTAVGCHAALGPMPAAASLDLLEGNGYADLVGVASEQCGDRKRVEAGVPSASYLLHKVRGVNLCFGTKMPKVGPGLGEAQIDSIAAWICAGAPP